MDGHNNIGEATSNITATDGPVCVAKFSKNFVSDDAQLQFSLFTALKSSRLVPKKDVRLWVFLMGCHVTLSEALANITANGGSGCVAKFGKNYLSEDSQLQFLLCTALKSSRLVPKKDVRHLILLMDCHVTLSEALGNISATGGSGCVAKFSKKFILGEADLRYLLH